MTDSPEVAAAAARLAQATSLSYQEAKRVLETAVESVLPRQDLRSDSDIFDELTLKPESLSVQVFMADLGLDAVGMRELLREYRSECGWSAFELSERDLLGSEFLNWFEWERLG